MIDYGQLAQGVAIMFGMVLVLEVILYLLWKGLKRVKLPILYNVFRKKMKKKDILWCANAINKGWNIDKCKMNLLIEGTHKKKVDEMAYIYKQVKKQMKGGGEKNAKTRNRTSA